MAMMKEPWSLEKPGWQLSDISVSLRKLSHMFSLATRGWEDLPLLSKRRALENNQKYGSNIGASYQ
jgi:hypothetical protein